MKNCLTCKLNKECEFGQAVNTFKEYSQSDDGIGTIVHLTLDNIKQYMNCSSYVKND